MSRVFVNFIFNILIMLLANMYYFFPFQIGCNILSMQSTVSSSPSSCAVCPMALVEWKRLSLFIISCDTVDRQYLATKMKQKQNKMKMTLTQMLPLLELLLLLLPLVKLR